MKADELKIGDTVRVEMYLKVKKYANEGDGIQLAGYVSTGSEKGTYVVGIPIHCCEVFDPSKMMENVVEEKSPF